MRAHLIIIVGVAWLVTSAVSFAQQQFEATQGDQISTTIESEKTTDGKVVEPSQHSTVVVMMSEKGLEVISPGADAQLGIGEKVVTEPVEHEQRIGEGIYDKKSHGGIRLFGWFF